jgi:hypothetical protein
LDPLLRNRRHNEVSKTTVHARAGKIEVEIKTGKGKTSKLTLEPDEALDLGIKLLKAAYSTKAKER